MSRPWIVYQAQGPAATVGMVAARFAFRGQAQKYADRLPEPGDVRWAVREEPEECATLAR